jgi:hypothetical protein
MEKERRYLDGNLARVEMWETALYYLMATI